MSKKTGLGRGLSALIPESSPENGLRTVPISHISPNPHQPRTHMDEVKLAELADSIREHGLIQPLIVHDAGDGQYTLIAGERRWRAAQKAGLTELPVVVKEASPQSMLELAIIENVQRADLNPLEEALAYRQLMDEFGLTQIEVSKRVGKARSTVGNTVRLLDLPPEVQQAVNEGQLTEGHARPLLSLPTPEMQKELMGTVIKMGLNVRQTEELVRKRLVTEKPAARPQKRQTPELRSLQEQFRQSLGTKVDVEKNPKGQGKIVIHFYSDEELQAIFDTIVHTT
ncbi:MAG: ParB/RepB/Spo0J family partition protein [Chloroflexi bacterium]|nr:ParB/RepB/Spo0J family partition protein [Chloroflexota bacterium]